MKLITVFTPTYNRGHLLQRAYEALCRQENDNFEWLIVDDGSTDNTEEIVKKWQTENKIIIRYIKKENGGVGSAYKCAIENTDTELIIAIDSDDYLPDGGIELIEKFWNENKEDKYAGIVAIDKYFDGRVVGDLLPDQKDVNLIDLLVGKYNIDNGDRTDVVRTELYKEAIASPDYNEKLGFEPHNIHLIMSRKYDFLVLNECLKFVEYQPDGLTNTLYARIVKYAENFALTRLLYLTFKNTGIKFRIKTYLHLISESILAKKMSLMFKGDSKIVPIILFIPGWLLSIYIRNKAKKI